MENLQLCLDDWIWFWVRGGGPAASGSGTGGRVTRVDDWTLMLGLGFGLCHFGGVE